ncbi:mRNA 3' end processing factor [Emydomyces testavorans]|uniref:mRNA 3' end processing factor n=1 Tax=Emydomyces testavorans TaxID=2070801 RepID=A0AAF0ILB8_9EURO|nr:mRNA 3' end processing factor [Emydomyces testavorans]
MSGLASDEVAEDYKNSLEDLTTNDKFQISNLTVIAKENTEHAMAISRVLENHIRTTPPSQKLPALYVVDSVVKNVGTPYTLFLGRNLYQTFMNAYTLVDSQTRKKLDEMLKTWKEPVPGSLDPRPVFPVEVTRSIENALIKARTAALHQQQARQQQELRSRTRGVATPPPTWKTTPTPPQAPAPYSLSTGQTQHLQTNGHIHPRHTHTPPSQYPPAAQHKYSYGQSYQEVVDLASLHRDIDTLIMSARNDFANKPLDTAIQQRLKALLDLQSILQQQKLPQDQLKLIRNQVSKLSTIAPAPSLAPAAVPVPPISTPQIPTLTTPQPNLQTLLNPSTLAELIKATANPQSRTPPPQPAAFAPLIPVGTTGPASVSTPAASENPLIASLRARGLLPPVSSGPVQPPPANLPFILPGQNGYTPSATPQIPSPIQANIKVNVQMSSASIKIPRPNLIFRLYEDKPNRCGTCGRRFAADDKGKEKKARHLDWHFKTNLRMNEASRRGQSRSWYVDERDWIKSREYDDDVGLTDATTSVSKSVGEDGAAEKAPQQRWIHAPNDATLRNTPCPICQEQFESTWSEEAQDWIWRDAMKVGSRVYHASCYSELTKDGTIAFGSLTPVRRTATPDSVLGKRKAEVDIDFTGSNVRIKTEPVA